MGDLVVWIQIILRGPIEEGVGSHLLRALDLSSVGPTPRYYNDAHLTRTRLCAMRDHRDELGTIHRCGRVSKRSAS